MSHTAARDRVLLPICSSWHPRQTIPAAHMLSVLVSPSLGAVSPSLGGLILLVAPRLGLPLGHGLAGWCPQATTGVPASDQFGSNPALLNTEQTDIECLCWSSAKPLSRQRSHQRSTGGWPATARATHLRVQGLPSRRASSGSTVKMLPLLKPLCSRSTQWPHNTCRHVSQADRQYVSSERANRHTICHTLLSSSKAPHRAVC
jgi:hypothetical protein